jgi:hypothetical protein
LGFITGEWRDAAATRRACLLGECLSHVLVLNLSKQCVRSSINLPEYDIE